MAGNAEFQKAQEEAIKKWLRDCTEQWRKSRKMIANGDPNASELYALAAAETVVDYAKDYGVDLDAFIESEEERRQIEADAKEYRDYIEGHLL